MSNTSLVVITSASGKQNSHLIPHLYNDPLYRLRLLVRSSSSKERLSKQWPNAEIVQVDLTEPADVRKAVKDANVVYHVGPPFHAHETEIGYNVIDACVATSKQDGSKFKHFVYSSVLCTQLRKLLNHDCKRYVEEWLMESGLNYTILKPTNFMDNFPIQMFLSQPKDNTVMKAPWNFDNSFSQIALVDLGEAGAKVIKEGDKHYMAEYPLCSTRPTPYRKVYETIGQGIGREIKIESVPFKEATETFIKRAIGENPSWQSRDEAQRMILYYDNHGLQGNPNILEWLLGRKATTVAQWTQLQLEQVEKGQK